MRPDPLRAVTEDLLAIRARRHLEAREHQAREDADAAWIMGTLFGLVVVMAVLLWVWWGS